MSAEDESPPKKYAKLSPEQERGEKYAGLPEIRFEYNADEQRYERLTDPQVAKKQVKFAKLLGKDRKVPSDQEVAEAGAVENSPTYAGRTRGNLLSMTVTYEDMKKAEDMYNEGKLTRADMVYLTLDYLNDASLFPTEKSRGDQREIIRGSQLEQIMGELSQAAYYVTDKGATISQVQEVVEKATPFRLHKPDEAAPARNEELRKLQIHRIYTNSRRYTQIQAIGEQDEGGNYFQRYVRGQGNPGQHMTFSIGPEDDPDFVVLAITGTQGRKNPRDWGTNILTVGLQNSVMKVLKGGEEMWSKGDRHRQEAEMLEALLRQYNDTRTRIVLTGHSLGGGIARDLAETYNVQAITFNSAASASDASFKPEPNTPGQPTVPVQSYNLFIENDPVSAIGGQRAEQGDKSNVMWIEHAAAMKAHRENKTSNEHSAFGGASNQLAPQLPKGNQFFKQVRHPHMLAHFVSKGFRDATYNVLGLPWPPIDFEPSAKEHRGQRRTNLDDPTLTPRFKRAVGVTPQGRFRTFFEPPQWQGGLITGADNAAGIFGAIMGPRYLHRAFGQRVNYVTLVKKATSGLALGKGSLAGGFYINDHYFKQHNESDFSTRRIRQRERKKDPLIEQKFGWNVTHQKQTITDIIRNASIAGYHNSVPNNFMAIVRALGN